jgi:transposase-like protein
MTKWKDAAFKEVVVAEYLAGGTDQRTLGAKYNIDPTTVSSWVRAYRGIKNKRTPRVGAKKEKKQIIEVLDQGAQSKKIRQLHRDLRQAKLHNELLQNMIDIAEKDLGVSIRKKSGTKRS